MRLRGTTLYLTGHARHLAKPCQRKPCQRKPRQRKPRQRGLTLIELLATLAVLLSLTAWAIPGYQRMVARHEVATEVMRLKTALALARNTAITRRQVVAVCPVASPGDERCHDADWALPLVIVDGHTTAGRLEDAEVLRVLEPGGGPLSVTFNRNPPVRYQSTGWARGHNGTFTVCGRHGQGAKLIVNVMGRVRVGDARDGPPEC